MIKADAMARWKRTPADLPILEHVTPIPYKAEGSRYGAGGIRIDGTPEFVDAVLSRLKDLLSCENDRTRLELARSEVKPRTIAGETKTFANACDRAETCYIRVHARGRESTMARRRFRR